MIMIHACPERHWYVDEYLVPMLEEQGVTGINIWMDCEHKGNLPSCMESFASLPETGGTWHLQDDILICRDFAKRIRTLPEDKIICGFVNELAGPNCNLRGECYPPDMWYSFPCTFIPNHFARECAEWYYSGRWKDEDAQGLGHLLEEGKSGDDWFFREYLQLLHPTEMVLNLTPCLVDHIDWLIGGSRVSPYRGFLSRAVYWPDETRLQDLKEKLKDNSRATVTSTEALS